MIERLSSIDVTFLHRETRCLPQHVGGLAVFAEPPWGFDYDRLVRLLEERISLAPRYRQKVRAVPGRLANPVWVDDPSFDITYHVRRSVLPRPGTDAALLEFSARIQSRTLDRSRPLWEMYLVEGLSDGRVAIVTKTHEAMVDDAGGIDIAEVILDAAPAPRRTVEAVWMPRNEPTPAELVRDALVDVLHRPVAAAEAVRAAASDVRSTARHTTRRAGDAAGAVVGGLAGGLAVAATSLVRRPVTSALSGRVGEQRRVAVARTRLDDYRAVRDVFGGTINDVVLAVVAGALRGWLLSRAEPLRASSCVRALVPVSVADTPHDLAHDPTVIADAAGIADGARRGSGTVRPLLVDLPVGEPDPALRLAQLRYAMATHHASGRAVGADRLAGLHDFAPATLHALGARAASRLARRFYSLVVTNVPGPQLALYAAGARMTEMFPIQPLTAGQVVSIALTSYDGGVFFGLNADRDALADVGTLAELVEESLAELVATAEHTAPSSRRASQRGPVGVPEAPDSQDRG